ncbi:radical SAM protein [Paenibacillus polymyxa]|uniref:radical SAM protein n=1 Tax=Paenibacillus polymyxa TaxID=1406 RepID=UPI002AB363C0|nr:radical SAM protein [Paenibacillus polymyxa]MDY8095858.1 radical SAM protein [Paenibacillus polymyxa]
MNSKANLLKVFNDQFLYDGSLGETYLLGKDVVNVIKEIANSSWESLNILDEEELSVAQKIVIKERDRGRFIGEPFKGVDYPSLNELFCTDISQMTLIVTEQCNLRCSYCPYSTESTDLYRSHRDKKMTRETADMSIKYFLDNVKDGSGIGYYGGEPFLNFDIIKYVTNKVKTNLKEQKIIFSVTSNLNVFSKEIAKFLVENNFILVVSLDGPQEVHDCNRRSHNGKGTFSNLMKNLDFLKENYPEFYKNNVLTNTVLAPPFEFEKIDDFFSGFDTKLLFSRFSLASDANNDFYPDRGTNINEAADQVFNWVMKKMYDLIINKQAVESSPLLKGVLQQYVQILKSPHVAANDKKLPFKSCIPGSKLAVNVDGSLSICERCESLKIGDIENGIDIEYTKQLVNEWVAFMQGKCSGCWAALYCKCCYITAWDGEKFNQDRQKTFCENTKKSVERWLNLYLPIKKLNPHFFDFINEDEEQFL